MHGSDVHPLAAIIAKTNYILALGDLIRQRSGRFSLPVYLADTLKVPSRYPHTDDYEVQLDNQTVFLSGELLKDLSVYDEAVELANGFAEQRKGSTTAPREFQSYLEAQNFAGLENAEMVSYLFELAGTLRGFMEADRDSIWAYVLKNSYKPIFLRRKFDLVVGNPPWVAFRSLDVDYQTFVKSQVQHEYNLLGPRGELITHLEVASLFLARAADLYLKHGGTIAFVLPKTVFTGEQHDRLRRRAFKLSDDPTQTLAWFEAWDCEGVAPLFSVPSCVLFARKEQISPTAPSQIPALLLTGTLDRKNETLARAESLIGVEHVTLSLHTRNQRSFWAPGDSTHMRSDGWYKSHFEQGATIVPRTFWFVQLARSPLGFDPNLPPLVTDPRAIAEAKQSYKSVSFEQNVEKPFVYATVLGSDVLPFSHLPYRPAVLPLQPVGEHYKLLPASAALTAGFVHLEQWLSKAQAEWETARRGKASRLNVLQWLDYRYKLTKQLSRVTYSVVYPDVQRVAVAAICEWDPTLPLSGDAAFCGSGLIIDSTLYHYDTDNIAEAQYLCSCLNSSVIDDRLSILRRRNQKAHPHVHKKVFDVAPIPKFDPEDVAHARLAALAHECAAAAQSWLGDRPPGSPTEIGKMRKLVRQVIAVGLAEIDRLVASILTT